MSILDQIKAANKNGEVFIIKNPEDLVEQLPDGRSVLALLKEGPHRDSNMKTSRYMGVQRSEPAVLLKPLKYIVRGPKGGVASKGTLKVGDAIRIMGWPGFTDKNNCDLLVLAGDEDLPRGDDAAEIFHKRLVQCKEGYYINLEEGVDYEYTGVAPISAAKTKVEVIAARDIEYVDEIGCDGIIYTMTAMLLCTQFGETFLECEGTRIMDNPVEGDDYI